MLSPLQKFKETQKRTRQLQALRKKGISLKTLSRTFNCSDEAIRSWLKPPSFCTIHERTYYTKCLNCQREKKVKDFGVLLSLIKNGEIEDQIRRLRIKSRMQSIFRQRALLTVKLRDHYKFSWPEIGRLFNQDHSSAIHAYRRGKTRKFSYN